jgi:peptidoglycan/LPS O-acetylase OafA/YrhL
VVAAVGDRSFVQLLGVEQDTFGVAVYSFPICSDCCLLLVVGFVFIFLSSLLLLHLVENWLRYRGFRVCAPAVIVRARVLGTLRFGDQFRAGFLGADCSEFDLATMALL